MKKLIVALIMASVFGLTLGCGDKPTTKGSSAAPKTGDTGSKAPEGEKKP